MISNVISVIIACYNGKKYLAEAIAGLRAQETALEILVVDDASADGSAQLARDLGVTVRTMPHSGQAVARNAGLSLACGRFILFHDQDDVLHPYVLPRMLEVLHSMPESPAVMAQAQDFLSPDLGHEDRVRLRPRENPYFGYLGATLFRKEVLDAVGGFSETLKAGEAADLLFRIQATGRVVTHVPFIAIQRRIHGNNASRTMRGQQFKEYAGSLRAHLRQEIIPR